MKRPLLALLLVAVLALGAAAPASLAKKRHHHQASRPNIVFVLTDDLSWNLIDKRFAPHVVDLQKRGVTFDHYFVSDSLCCPSRTSIYTGLFPHDSQVFTNLPPFGGFSKFQAQGLDKRTFATAIQPRGYRTSMLGKYLNGYGDPSMNPFSAPVPPGWSDWHVSNVTGYAEFNYLLNENGTYTQYGPRTGGCGMDGTPNSYGVDVLGQKASAFVSAARRKPFVMEIATFAPHAPYTPAPRNACDFPGLKQPRDPSFDTNNVNPPAWLGQRDPLRPAQIRTIDQSYRKRAQSVEAVDKLIGDLEAQLAASGQLRNTYFVFSSDNGYHLGQHRLPRGKQTAFDTDIRVPLIVAGPGVPRGKVVHEVAQNVDLHPTFVELAGGRPAPSVDGHSLVPLLHARGWRGWRPWRTVALVEHKGQAVAPSDPDTEAGPRGGNPTTYEAIRISTRHLAGFRGPVEAVYVEYDDAAREREYYDIAQDPYERVNIAGLLTARQKAVLHKLLTRLASCHGARQCWRAGEPR